MIRASHPIRVMLIEDNTADARLIREMLRESKNVVFEVTHVLCLSEGLEYLKNGSADVVLLDLSLPDSVWPDTLLKVLMQSPDVPVVVLTGTDDDRLAFEAVHKGAQDYIVKGQLDTNLLVRAVRYAIERHRMGKELRALSLTDDLTGIYNRRGFLTIAQQQLKMASRMKMGVLLFFADLDDMKLINDNFGHQEGDRALVDSANILKETFRESDVVARMGGDEFAIMAFEESGVNDEKLADRLQKKIDEHNARKNRPYKLSLSLGIVRCDPDGPCSIDSLLERADKLMYEQKRIRKKSRL